MKRSTLFLCGLLLNVCFANGYEEGFIKLVGGQDNSEGRVEIFHNGAWGTVCDDDWEIKDAQVVCRQLHYPGAKEALGSTAFGQGSGNIWMDDLACTGNEISLLQCTSPGWGVHNCGHSEDAAVRCEIGAEPNTRDLTPEYTLDHNATLPEQLGELFDSEHDCDLNIPVVVDNSTVETVCAHSVILFLNPNLKASQPDFQRLRINVTSDCSQYARTFVRYIYTRKVKFTIPSAYCIIKMASDWGLQDLQNEAAKVFREFLPEDSTFQSQISFCQYAVVINDEALKDVCIRYLAWNCEALIDSPAWTKLPLFIVKALLSSSDILVRNETVILHGLEKWAAAQEDTTIPKILLKLIRFPMISAEDLYRLDGSQYHTSKLQGFQFNALPISIILSDMTEQRNIYTPRIYNGPTWSFTFSTQEVRAYNHSGHYIFKGQQMGTLTSDFQTPVHSSSYFAFQTVIWQAKVLVSEKDCTRESVSCSSLPAVSLKIKEKQGNLPSEMADRIGYRNRIVLKCKERHVFHIDEFNSVNSDNLIFIPSLAEQTYPCHSGRLSYQVVVCPYYST
ncbi:galectin-3-binding protein B-like [Gambusia affinis]|uniref:galectin-3-binding protein B-like n=1 Tax=Gambusia affinis TaxID=33528 RepID=UPI001CDC0C64|nr:galectin-3-binding protein B-like [Gambusia affinis]